MQVHDSLENILAANGMNEAVDWLKLKENELVKAKDSDTDTRQKTDEKRGNKRKIKPNFCNSFQLDVTRRRSDTSTSSDSSDPVKRKLSEVLSEGLLDSVLPYLVPSSSQQTSRRNSTVKVPSGIVHFCTREQPVSDWFTYTN